MGKMGYDAIVVGEMDHVATGYVLGMSLAENAEKWLLVTEISTFQGFDRNPMRLTPSSVVQAFPVEVKIESEAQDAVGWECCKGDEGEVGEEPKARLCKPV